MSVPARIIEMLQKAIGSVLDKQHRTRESNGGKLVQLYSSAGLRLLEGKVGDETPSWSKAYRGKERQESAADIENELSDEAWFT